MYYALPCTWWGYKDIGIYHRYIFCAVLIIILIPVLDILFWFFCFSAIKTISMRNLPWECVSMLVGWLQTWCSNNVLKMRLSLSSVPVAMEESRTPILLLIPGVNISKMWELSTRLEQRFESGCKFYFSWLTYYWTSIFTVMKDWKGFKSTQMKIKNSNTSTVTRCRCMSLILL